MSELTFSQSERRNLAGPILLAAAILAVICVVAYLVVPHRTADVTITHLAVVPEHTVFKSDSKVVGVPDEAYDDLYVLATVRIVDRLRIPLFISDITGTITAPDDTAANTSALRKDDIDNVFLSFPNVKPLASAPLLRETTIQPGGNAEGMVLLHFPITKSVWDQRKSANITIDFYHQDPLTVPIPK